MSDLRFRCLVDSYLCELASFEAYIEKGSVDSGLILIAFDETDLDIIRKIFRDNVHEERTSFIDKIQLVGTDNYLYIMSQTSLKKQDKMPHSIMKAYRYYKGYKKKQLRADAYIRREIENNEDGIRKIHGGKFGSYKYTDKANKMSIPFRFVNAKESNRPLFVLFHGAGAMGNDNIKQMFDNIPLYCQIAKMDCNILFPQAPFGANRGDDMIQGYIKSIKNLIDYLPADFDKNRIYIVGTSFGGFCVWNLVYQFSDYFAAAVPVMGSLCIDGNFEKYDIQQLIRTPLWAAHSSDDTNVKIDSDDFFITEMKKLNADVKYTRWDKYGHSMSGKFYRKEKWAEWCLSKELK